MMEEMKLLKRLDDCIEYAEKNNLKEYIAVHKYKNQAKNYIIYVNTHIEARNILTKIESNKNNFKELRNLYDDHFVHFMHSSSRKGIYPNYYYYFTQNIYKEILEAPLREILNSLPNYEFNVYNSTVNNNGIYNFKTRSNTLVKFRIDIDFESPRVFVNGVEYHIANSNDVNKLFDYLEGLEQESELLVTK